MYVRNHCGLIQKMATTNGFIFVRRRRSALALELVAAHTEEAAKARQESALNAAKFRRASRDAGLTAVVAWPEQGNQSAPKKTSGGRPQTSSANR